MQVNIFVLIWSGSCIAEIQIAVVTFLIVFIIFIVHANEDSVARRIGAGGAPVTESARAYTYYSSECR